MEVMGAELNAEASKTEALQAARLCYRPGKGCKCGIL